MRPVAETRILETEPLHNHVRRKDDIIRRPVDRPGRQEGSCLRVEGDDGVPVDVELADLELDRDLGAGALEHAEPPLLS